MADDVDAGGARGFGGPHEILLAQHEDFGAHDARERGPGGKAEHEDQPVEAIAEEGQDEHGQEEAGRCLEELRHPHDSLIDQPSQIAGKEAERHSDGERDGGHRSGKEDRGSRAPQHPAQEVAAQGVGAHQMGEGWWVQR